MNEYISSEELSRGLKRRIIVLIVTSMMVVALTFGLSFYFALVSNETAVAKQMPELESLVGTLKRILFINTFAFVAVIIASLYALTSLVTTRMFRPLESIMTDLLTIRKGTLPIHRKPVREEPFAGFDEMFGSVLSVLQEREQKEIDEIRQCISILSNEPDVERIKCMLRTMLQEKGDFIGSSVDGIQEEKTAAEQDDALFMQPV